MCIRDRHIGLTLKPEPIGIRGKLLKWFHSYLTDRTQAAVIKGEKSIEKNPSGVPQGSVLGPLLFLIFINDIVQNIGFVIKLFSDDTSMSLGLANPESRTETLTNDLAKIGEWAKLRKVKFSKEKTEPVNIKRDTQCSVRRKASPETPRNHCSKQLQVGRTHE